MFTAKILKELGKRDPIQAGYKTRASQQTQAVGLYMKYKQYYLLNAEELAWVRSITGIDTFILELKEIARKQGKSIPVSRDMRAQFYEKLLNDEIESRKAFNKAHWFRKKSFKDLEEFKEKIKTEVNFDFENTHQQLYKLYIDKLNVTIKAIETANKNKWFWKKESTYHLEYVKQMLEYHCDVRHDLIRPTERLNNGKLKDETLQKHFISEQQAHKPMAVKAFARNIAKLWSFLWGKNRKLKRLQEAHEQKSQKMHTEREKIGLDIESVADKIHQKTLILADSTSNEKSALVQLDSITKTLNYEGFLTQVRDLKFQPTIQCEVDFVNALFKFLQKTEELLNITTAQSFDILKADCLSILDTEDIKQKLSFTGTAAFNELLTQCRNCSINGKEEFKKARDNFADTKIIELLTLTDKTKVIWEETTLQQQYNNFRYLESSQCSASITPERCVRNYALLKPSSTMPRDKLANNLFDETERYTKSLLDSSIMEAEITDENQLDFLKKLYQISQLQKISLGVMWQSFLNHGQDNKPKDNTEYLMNLGGRIAATKTYRDQLQLEINKQVKFLSYLKNNLTKAYAKNLQAEQSTEGNENDYSQRFKELIDELAPASASDSCENLSYNERYNKIIEKINKEMQTLLNLAHNVKSIKIAVKFFAGQASYKIKSIEKDDIQDEIQAEYNRYNTPIFGQ